MIDIKSRGQRKDNGEWVFGYYYKNKDKGFIKTDEYILNEQTFPGYGFMLQVEHEVKTDTFSICTGKKDVNGKEIYYASDIFEFVGMLTRNTFQVFRGSFVFNWITLSTDVRFIREKVYLPYDRITMKDFKIIGTVQDNPELLEV